jgi:glutathione S-transferase
METVAKPVLAFFPGSPFARMARVIVREWALPVEEIECPFPPPPEFFEKTPLGQVPVLLIDGVAVFPTLLVLERLWAMAGNPPHAYRPDQDRQVLLTILQAGDALVAALYQDWAGLRPVGPNHIGYDPGERHLERFRQSLAWYEARVRGHENQKEPTLPDIALVCLLLWSQARGGPGWQGHNGLELVVRHLEERPSFAATRPPPWRPV